MDLHTGQKRDVRLSVHTVCGDETTNVYIGNLGLAPFLIQTINNKINNKELGWALCRLPLKHWMNAV